MTADEVVVGRELIVNDTESRNSPRHALVRNNTSFGHEADDRVEALHVVVGPHHAESIPDEIVQLTIATAGEQAWTSRARKG